MIKATVQTDGLSDMSGDSPSKVISGIAKTIRRWSFHQTLYRNPPKVDPQVIMLSRNLFHESPYSESAIVVVFIRDEFILRVAFILSDLFNNDITPVLVSPSSHLNVGLIWLQRFKLSFACFAQWGRDFGYFIEVKSAHIFCWVSKKSDKSH